MTKWLGVALGLLTAIGGFVDVGALATAAEAGAKFQLGLVWAFLVATFAIIVLLEMAGRYASVSQRPYSGAIRQHLGFKYYLLPLGACLLANTLMLPAEVGGMAVALSLVLGVNWFVLYPVAALFVWLCAWFSSFKLIENGPALLGLVTLAFVAGVIGLGGPRPQLLTTLWHPDVAGQVPGYLFLAAAILGAIISPYLVVFYSSGAREEGWSSASLGVNRVTAVVGMAFGCVAALGILTLSAMTLGPMHVQAGTLGEVALALARPFGPLGAYLFAGALFVTCWGAALEITLAMSYNISQGFGWNWGVDRPHREAARFRLTMLLFLALAFCVGLLGLDPLTLTIYASAFTALILPISLFPFLVVMNNPKYLGDKVNGRLGNVAAIAVVVLAFVIALVSIPLFLLTGGQA
ncbi:MAG TPA: divalent metal cation transporter [Candidatus Dormibacteraeota bacterium]|nr:divalent metal cation transporter [Candidatus Dormibacteraeota bacterium]